MKKIVNAGSSVSRYLRVPLPAIGKNSLMPPVVTLKFINGVLIGVGCDVCLPVAASCAGNFQDDCHQNMMLCWKRNFLSLQRVEYRLNMQLEILFLALDSHRTQRKNIVPGSHVYMSRRWRAEVMTRVLKKPASGWDSMNVKVPIWKPETHHERLFEL